MRGQSREVLTDAKAGDNKAREPLEGAREEVEKKVETDRSNQEFQTTWVATPERRQRRCDAN